MDVELSINFEFFSVGQVSGVYCTFTVSDKSPTLAQRIEEITQPVVMTTELVCVKCTTSTSRNIRQPSKLCKI